LSNANFLFTSESVTEGHPIKSPTKVPMRFRCDSWNKTRRSCRLCETLYKPVLAVVAEKSQTSAKSIINKSSARRLMKSVITMPFTAMTLTLAA
jgi:S-adenosylmethionine synthetase